MRRLQISLIFMLITFFRCSGEPDTYTVEIIDGVRHVHNIATLWGDESKLELQFVRQMGGIDETDVNYQFFRVFCVLKDNDNNTYVLENGNKRVQKFDPDWMYMITIGSEGQGPGELEYPYLMDINLDTGIIYVADPGNSRISMFNLAGVFTGSILFTQLQSVRSIRSIGNGNLVTQVITYSVPGQEEQEEKYLLIAVNSKGEIVNKFGEYLRHEEERIERSRNNVLFETDIDNNIYVTFNYENIVEKYTSDGRLIFRADRPLNFEVEHKMVYLSSYGRSFPDMVRVSGNICVDGMGRSWISTYDSIPEKDENLDNITDAKRHLHVFDTDGIFLGAVEYPGEEYVLLKIQGDTAFFTDNDYITVMEYKIVEK
ncbi:6-bladed beta-propeller [candidate division KSB1 bacterium]